MLKPRIALITGWTDPERHSIVEICIKILNILTPFSENLTWVVTNVSSEIHLDKRIRLIRLKSKFVPRRGSTLKIIPYMLLYQIKVAWSTLKLLQSNDAFIFTQGSDLSFLPMLLVKMRGRKLILRSDGRPSLLVKKYFESPGRLKLLLLRLIESLSYGLADRILPENQQLAIVYEMQKYGAKISIGSQYVDTTTFKRVKPLSDRKYAVGYIGRLITEKGALEFVQALPLIFKNVSSRRGIIIGSGYLQSEIEKVLIDSKIRNQVESLNWIENEKLSDYLNDIKLVVVPSHYEGLSNLMLEAMACGTLVLATAVGGTPGIVREGETGFLLENNSSECIARNVTRVLKGTELDRIQENAYSQIHRAYSYPAAVSRYRNIFESLGFKVDSSIGLVMDKEKKDAITINSNVVT